MKKFLLFFVVSFFSYAQESITYSDLKKMTDGSMSEAVSIMKSKGFSFGKSEDNYVSYSKQNDDIIIQKRRDKEVRLTLFDKKNEYISNNILNYIKKIGYSEVASNTTSEDGFCTYYESTNYYIGFCDNKLIHNNKMYYYYKVLMQNKANME